MSPAESGSTQLNQLHKERIYPCPCAKGLATSTITQCTKTFPLARLAVQHMVKEHRQQLYDEQSHHVCHACKIGFMTKRQRQLHQDDNGCRMQYPYPCAKGTKSLVQCTKTFRSESLAFYHMIEEHGRLLYDLYDGTGLVCSKCELGFMTGGQLFLHRDTNGCKETPCPAAAVGLLSCPVLSLNRAVANIHLRIHDGELYTAEHYPCTVCKIGFITANKLQRHYQDGKCHSLPATGSKLRWPARFPITGQLVVIARNSLREADIGIADQNSNCEPRLRHVLREYWMRSASRMCNARL